VVGAAGALVAGGACGSDRRPSASGVLARLSACQRALLRVADGLSRIRRLLPAPLGTSIAALLASSWRSRPLTRAPRLQPPTPTPTPTLHPPPPQVHHDQRRHACRHSGLPAPAQALWAVAAPGARVLRRAAGAAAERGPPGAGQGRVLGGGAGRCWLLLLDGNPVCWGPPWLGLDEACSQALGYPTPPHPAREHRRPAHPLAPTHPCTRSSWRRPSRWRSCQTP
jgi:hypothetical protein